METENNQISARKIHFLTLPGEKLLASERKHWFVIVAPLVYLVAFGLLLFSLNFYLFFILSPSLLFFSLASLLILLLLTNIMTKLLVEWYFHVYIITTKKIVEMSYAPLSSQSVNEVLLDQVRCTEIDTKTHGMINEFIEKGDVIVTFDRPTHQEECILADVYKPEALGLFLGDTLSMLHQARFGPNWYRQKNGKSNYYFTDDLLPNQVN